MRIAIDTLGCKVNRYDSVVLEEALIRDKHEVVSSDESADVYVINSCTGTSGADSDTRQLIRRFQKKNSDAIIFVTGCSAQTQPEVYASMPGVHFVIGSDLKSEIPRLIREIASVPSAPRNDELRHPEPKAKDPSERLLRFARNDETARNDELRHPEPKAKDPSERLLRSARNDETARNDELRHPEPKAKDPSERLLRSARNDET